MGKIDGLAYAPNTPILMFSHQPQNVIFQLTPIHAYLEFILKYMVNGTDPESL